MFDVSCSQERKRGEDNLCLIHLDCRRHHYDYWGFVFYMLIVGAEARHDF